MSSLIPVARLTVFDHSDTRFMSAWHDSFSTEVEHDLYGNPGNPETGEWPNLGRVANYPVFYDIEADRLVCTERARKVLYVNRRRYSGERKDLWESHWVAFWAKCGVDLTVVDALLEGIVDQPYETTYGSTRSFPVGFDTPDGTIELFDPQQAERLNSLIRERYDSFRASLPTV
jgi:hypothetical protein